MLELPREIERKGTVANTITYNALISACEKGRMWERALELAREIERKGTLANTITYNALISACECWLDAKLSMPSSRWAGRRNHILADGRDGVLQKEMAAYLCDVLGLSARPSACNDGELRLSAAEINGWLASGKGEVAALVS